MDIQLHALVGVSPTTWNLGSPALRQQTAPFFSGMGQSNLTLLKKKTYFGNTWLYMNIDIEYIRWIVFRKQAWLYIHSLYHDEPTRRSKTDLRDVPRWPPGLPSSLDLRFSFLFCFTSKSRTSLFEIMSSIECQWIFRHVNWFVTSDG